MFFKCLLIRKQLKATASYQKFEKQSVHLEMLCQAKQKLGLVWSVANMVKQLCHTSIIGQCGTNDALSDVKYLALPSV